MERHEILLTSSHTHTGPVIRESLVDMYDLPPEQAAVVSRYTAQLEEKVISLVETTLKSLAPAKLAFAQGEASFAANRRVITSEGIRFGVNPQGPVDHGVPVLKISDSNDRLLAVVVSYACHNTTLTGEFYQLSGDYAGFAQAFLERDLQQAVALFMMGCGADANPKPRGQLAMAERHGRSLADAVSKVLSQPMQALSGKLKTKFVRVNIPFGTLPARRELEKRLEEKDVFRQRHARRLLSILNQQGKLPGRYPYPIHVLQIGRELTLVALAGEVVVDYTLRLRNELGLEGLWTVAYANDVFAYIPSVRILREGGYEAKDSGIYYGMPAPFAPEVEDIIISEVKTAVKSVRRSVK